MENLDLEKEICRLYQEEFATLQELAKKYRKTTRTIKKILLKNNIEVLSIRKKYVSADVRNKIIELYQSRYMSCKDIGKEVGLGEHKVVDILKEAGCYKSHHRNKKHYCNSNYFAAIDTEEKAYWLGVFYADGNVSSTTPEIKFSSIDKEWIELFLNSIDSTDTPHREFHKVYQKEIWKARISDQQLHDDLISVGCVPAKSLVITFPQLQENLIPHFIRGYFDGDGFVSISNNSTKKENCFTLKSGFCSGSKTFIEQLVSYLPTKFKTISKRKKPNSSLYDIKLSVKDSYKLYKYMYTNATIFLQRKKDKFDNYIKQRRSETIIEDLEI